MYVRVALLGVLVAACTKPPQTPTLPGSREPEISQIALHERLTAKDFRQIFQALNRDGSLETLKPFIDGTSDEALEPLFDFVSSELYEGALDSRGLLRLLFDRIRRRSFSVLAGGVKPRDAHVADSYMKLLTWDRFPEVLDRDVEFLNPEWLALFVVSEEDSASLTLETTRDLRNLMLLPNVHDSFPSALRDFSNEPLRALVLSAKKFSSSKLWVEALRIQEKNFANLSKTLGTLDGPTDGFFQRISEKLPGNQELLFDLFQRFDKLPARSALWHLIKGLELNPIDWKKVSERKNGNPSDAFKALMQSIERSLQDVSEEVLPGNPKKPGDPAVLNHNLPVYLNSYVLARFLESISSGIVDWSTKLAKTQWSFSLSNGGKLSEEVRKDLTALNFADDFLPGLSHRVESEGYDFQVTFRVSEGTDLQSAVRYAYEYLQRLLPYSRPSEFVKVIAPLLNDPDIDALKLSGLEGPNFLATLEREFGRETYSQFKDKLRLLFEVWRIQEIAPPTQEKILSWYGDKPELQGRVRTLCSGLNGVANFVLDKKNEPLLVLLHEYLASMPPASVEKSHGIFRLLSEAKVFETNNQGLKHPALDGVLSKLGYFADTLSNVTNDNMSEFLVPFQAALSGVGAELNRDWVYSLLGSQSDENLNELFSNPSIKLDFTDAEREWLYRLGKDRRYLPLWKFMKESGSKTSAVKFLSALKDLNASGKLRKSVELLQYLQDPRAKRIASVLLEWLSSGEFEKMTSWVSAVAN